MSNEPFYHRAPLADRGTAPTLVMGPAKLDVVIYLGHDKNWTIQLVQLDDLGQPKVLSAGPPPTYVPLADISLNEASMQVYRRLESGDEELVATLTTENGGLMLYGPSATLTVVPPDSIITDADLLARRGRHHLRIVDPYPQTMYSLAGDFLLVDRLPTR